MIRHGPHRLRAQVYPLRSMSPFAVRTRNTAPMVKIGHNGTRLHCKTNRQGWAVPISSSHQAAAPAQRLPRQNPKSP